MGERILYLTQWFDPEYMVKGIKFVKALRDKGYDVEVATGIPNYPTGKVFPGYKLSLYQLEMMDGVRVHRLFLYPSHDGSSFGRAINYLSIFLSMLVFCLTRAWRFQAIYVYHPPITVGLAAALSGLITRRPFSIDIQDLWPDSVSVSGMAGTKSLAKILDPICRFVYRRAALVIGQSEAMTERLIERGAPRERTATIFNWADEDAAKPGGDYDVASLGFEGRFNFVFGGNLGRVQGLETVIRAAHKAAEILPQIQLTLIGEGVERDHLAGVIRELGADNVILRPGVPQSLIGDVFNAADVLVIHLAEDPLFEVTIPSKTQFYMAMGKPILVGVSGEAAKIVTSIGAGFAVPPDRVEHMADAMVQFAQLPRSELDAMGKRAREAYAAQFSFRSAIEQTDACLRTVLKPDPSCRSDLTFRA
jgi:colanic acid biosynthesis glycosyl transferase WcaI